METGTVLEAVEGEGVGLTFDEGDVVLADDHVPRVDGAAGDVDAQHPVGDVELDVLGSHQGAVPELKSPLRIWLTSSAWAGTAVPPSATAQVAAVRATRGDRDLGLLSTEVLP